MKTKKKAKPKKTPPRPGKPGQCFWFGKWKWIDLRDIPTNYLRWAVDNVDFTDDAWEKFKILLLLELLDRPDDVPTPAKMKVIDGGSEPSKPTQVSYMRLVV